MRGEPRPLKPLADGTLLRAVVLVRPGMILTDYQTRLLNGRSVAGSSEAPFRPWLEQHVKGVEHKGLKKVRVKRQLEGYVWRLGIYQRRSSCFEGRSVVGDLHAALHVH